MNEMGMKQTTIWHNPRCSKSQAAVELLQSRGVEFLVIKYLETPPNTQQLKQIVKLLGSKPADLVRKQEPLFDQLGLSDRTLSDDEWLTVLSENPQLIQRPIVIHAGKAAIGRPIDRIIEILEP